MGRWLTPDSSGLAYASLANLQSFNLYSYVRNNPLINTDPSGMECVWDDGSYDSADDPNTGDGTKCAGQGGTWIPPDDFESGLLTNGQNANIQPGSWSGEANAVIASSWIDNTPTVSASTSDIPLNGDFSFNMTSDQFIGMIQGSGFKVSALDTALGKTGLGHPGINMRDQFPVCSVHLNINPGTGVNGVPVSGEFHYDLFNPLKSLPAGPASDVPLMPLHAAADVGPDILMKQAHTSWTGNQECVTK